MSDINNFTEAQLVLAYIASFPAAIFSNYNFNETLRQVTLIQQKVDKDIDLFEVYKKLHHMRDIINR